MGQLFQSMYCYDNGVPFHQEELPNYYVDYIKVSNENLVIVFEGSEPKKDHEPWQRYPWGSMFICSQGCSVVGIKHKKPDWYRGADLHKFFMSDEFQDLLSGYKNVYLYGSSMGGYAVLAFAKFVAGAKILSCCPQSTMDPRLVPWDNRFPHARNQKWNGHVRDASQSLDDIDVAYVVYDPFFPADQSHIQRLPQEKLIHLKAPFFQHNVLKRMKEMGILKDLLTHFLRGDLETWFPKAMRKRKGHQLYQSTAYFHRALRFYQKGRRDEAIEMLRKSLTICVNNKASLNLFKAIDNAQPYQWEGYRKS